MQAPTTFLEQPSLLLRPDVLVPTSVNHQPPFNVPLPRSDQVDRQCISHHQSDQHQPPQSLFPSSWIIFMVFHLQCRRVKGGYPKCAYPAVIGLADAWLVCDHLIFSSCTSHLPCSEKMKAGSWKHAPFHGRAARDIYVVSLTG